MARIGSLVNRMEADTTALHRGIEETRRRLGILSPEQKLRRAMIKRSLMEAALKKGQSVQIGKRLVTKLENLPPEEELAKGDPERLAAVERELERQVNDNLFRLSQIRKDRPAESQAQTEKSVPAEAATDAPSSDEEGEGLPKEDAETEHRRAGRRGR